MSAKAIGTALIIVFMLMLASGCSPAPTSVAQTITQTATHTVTQTVAKTVTSTVTAPPATTPSPPQVQGSFCDLGDTEDEARHNLVGWGNQAGASQNPYISDFGDRTKRFQKIRSDNSIDLHVDTVGIEYLLTTEVEDGTATDNFEIYVNGQGPIYSYQGKNAGKSSGFGPLVVVHQVSIPGSYISKNIVTITFRNASVDDYGQAAVYSVRLTPTTK